MSTDRPESFRTERKENENIFDSTFVIQQAREALDAENVELMKSVLQKLGFTLETRTNMGAHSDEHLYTVRKGDRAFILELGSGTRGERILVYGKNADDSYLARTITFHTEPISRLKSEYNPKAKSLEEVFLEFFGDKVQSLDKHTGSDEIRTYVVKLDE